jgi:hypothetical protein
MDTTFASNLLVLEQLTEMKGFSCAFERRRRPWITLLRNRFEVCGRCSDPSYSLHLWKTVGITIWKRPDSTNRPLAITQISYDVCEHPRCAGRGVTGRL